MNSEYQTHPPPIQTLIMVKDYPNDVLFEIKIIFNLPSSVLFEGWRQLIINLWLKKMPYDIMY